MHVGDEASNPYEVALGAYSNPFRPLAQLWEAEDYDGNGEKSTTYWGIASLDTACDVITYLCDDNTWRRS